VREVASGVTGLLLITVLILVIILNLILLLSDDHVT
jgi:hypothetical protein